MAMICKILKMRHREKKSVREIVRATRLSRDTVRKCRRRPASTKLTTYV